MIIKYLLMQYFRIPGKRAKRSPSKNWALGRASLAMRRSGSVENRPNAMACNTFGWTPVASTDRTTPSSQKLLTQCFAGIVVRLDATSICRTFRALHSIPTIRPATYPLNQLFGQVDGLLEAGRSKSSLPRVRSNSSPEKVIDLVISGLFSNKFTK
jgi:hypothetical protein